MSLFTILSPHRLCSWCLSWRWFSDSLLSRRSLSSDAGLSHLVISRAVLLLRTKEGQYHLTYIFDRKCNICIILMILNRDLRSASDIMSGMRDVAPMVSRVQLTNDWPLTDHLCAHLVRGFRDRELCRLSAHSFGWSNASNCPINFLIILIVATLMVIINWQDHLLPTFLPPPQTKSNWGLCFIYCCAGAGSKSCSWYYSGKEHAELQIFTETDWHETGSESEEGLRALSPSHMGGERKQKS